MLLAALVAQLHALAVECCAPVAAPMPMAQPQTVLDWQHRGQHPFKWTAAGLKGTPHPHSLLVWCKRAAPGSLQRSRFGGSACTALLAASVVVWTQALQALVQAVRS